MQSLARQILQLRRDLSSYCLPGLQEMGLTQGLLIFVLYIGRHAGCTPVQLANDMQMDTGYVTRALKKLKQSGFIIQKENPEDRRSHVLFLTELGKNVFIRSYELMELWDAIAMLDLSDEERETLLHLLYKVKFQRIYPY